MSNYGSSTTRVEKFHNPNLNNSSTTSTPELSNNYNANKLNYNETDHHSNSLFTPPTKTNGNKIASNLQTQSLSTKLLDDEQLPMFDVNVNQAQAPAAVNTHTSFKPNLTSSPAAAGSGNCGWDASNQDSPSSHFLNTSQDRNNLISPIKHSNSPNFPVFTIGSDETSEGGNIMRTTGIEAGNLLSPPVQDVNHNTRHSKMPVHHRRSSSSPINNSHNLVNTGNEESFECYADGSQSFFDSNSENTSLQYSRDSNNDADLSVPDIFGGTNNCSSNNSGVSSLPAFKRNAVFRTSLRRSPQNNTDTMGHRRWGSFRNPSGVKRSFQPPISSTGTPNVNSSTSSIGNQLYRSSSFHSSGRSSAGDGEEMYSDGSLEDEVIDLKQTVHHLSEKFNVLSENQSEVDDRYTRSKQENIELSTKLFMLEEQLRDVEQRSDERIREEQKRSKESLQRLDREKQLQIENYEIRLHSLEKELEVQKLEAQRCKQSMERERSERIQISDKLFETERELTNARDDNRKLMESARSEREALALETIGSQQALLDLKREVENLRKFQMNKVIHKNSESIDGDSSELQSRVKELESENRRLKNKIKELEETNEDLTAQILNHGVEEGRNLLTMNHFGGGGMGNSIAAEFEAMSQDEVKRALKEQKEVNEQLKAYIDGILLNIVENYPQLLEVKNKCSSSPDSNGILCPGINSSEAIMKST